MAIKYNGTTIADANRPITNSYTGSSTTTDFSQKGANDLYKAMVRINKVVKTSFSINAFTKGYYTVKIGTNIANNNFIITSLRSTLIYGGGNIKFNIFTFLSNSNSVPDSLTDAIQTLQLIGKYYYEKYSSTNAFNAVSTYYSATNTNYDSVCMYIETIEAASMFNNFDLDIIIFSNIK